MSPWSTASISTNFCGSAPPRRGRNATPAATSGSSAMPTAWRSCLRDQVGRGDAAARPHRHRRRWREVPGRQAGSADRRHGALRLRLPRDHRGAEARHRQLRRQALRRLLPGQALARFLFLDLPAWRHRQHRHRLRAEGLLAARLDRRAAEDHRPRRRPHHPARRRADPDEARQALGQRPRRGAGGRCRGRGRPGLGRGHLLRHARRPAGGRSGGGMPRHRPTPPRSASPASAS